MAAKDVKFGSDARAKMLEGVDILANAVKTTLGVLQFSCVIEYVNFSVLQSFVKLTTTLLTPSLSDIPFMLKMFPDNEKGMDNPLKVTVMPPIFICCTTRLML